jgi:hypothetical protein
MTTRPDWFVRLVAGLVVLVPIVLFVYLALPPYWTPCWLAGHPTGCLTLPTPVIPVVLLLVVAVGLGLLARR